jgi:hypothetical protein
MLPATRDPFQPNLLIYVLLAATVGALIVTSPYVAAVIVLGGLVVLLVAQSPLKALAVLIFVTPFSGTELIRNSIIALPGAKPLQLIGLLVVVIVVMNYRAALKMPDGAFFFVVALMALFSLSVLRSLAYLDLINYYFEDSLSTARYLMSHYVKPLIYFLPFIVIAKFVRNRQDVSFIIDVVVVTLTILSVYLLYLYLFQIPDKTNLRAVSDYYGATLSLHRNHLGTFYISGFPFLLARYFYKKNVWSLAAICLAVCATAFLYSRAAYAAVLLSFLLYVAISKRARLLPVLAGAMVVLFVLLSGTVLERASKGLASGDLDEIAAGRIDSIWLPLIAEYSGDPQKLTFGHGRYAILASEAAERGRILFGVGHPHNMYLELLFDAGLIGLFALAPFYILFLRNAWRTLGHPADPAVRECAYAVTVGLLCYLLSGITDRSLFPNLPNCYLWIVLGLAVALTRLTQPVPNALQERNAVAIAAPAIDAHGPPPYHS